MTIYDEAWVKAEETKRAWMAEHGLYKEDDEHSSCGVGLVASISGTCSEIKSPAASASSSVISATPN